MNPAFFPFSFPHSAGASPAPGQAAAPARTPSLFDLVGGSAQGASLDQASEWASAIARILRSTDGAGLDRDWVLEGVRNQLKFWTALESALVRGGPEVELALSDEDRPPRLVVDGSLADPEILASFVVENPTDRELSFTITIGPLQDEDGKSVTDEVCAVDMLQLATPLAPAERRTIWVRVYPSRLPRAGRFRGRLTVRAPRARKLELEIWIRP